jgi:uncharacterized protein YndB with AHSA1/START domain
MNAYSFHLPFVVADDSRTRLTSTNVTPEIGEIDELIPVSWQARHLHSSVMRVSTSSITIRAPREIVWAAVTLPEHVRQWQYNSELTTDWTVGHPLAFRAEFEGQVFEQWGTVLEFDAPNRLRYSLFAPRPDLEDRPENYFTMTYELSEVAGTTSVTFTQEDPRESNGSSDDSDDENPVLVALRAVAESLAAH